MRACEPRFLTADHHATLVLQLDTVIGLIDLLPARPPATHKLLCEIFLGQAEYVTARGVAAGATNGQHSDARRRGWARRTREQAQRVQHAPRATMICVLYFDVYSPFLFGVLLLDARGAGAESVSSMCVRVPPIQILVVQQREGSLFSPFAVLLRPSLSPSAAVMWRNQEHHSSSIVSPIQAVLPLWSCSFKEKKQLGF